MGIRNLTMDSLYIEMFEKAIPKHIKQKGYTAERNGGVYRLEYMSGGHIPSEDVVELTNWPEG